LAQATEEPSGRREASPRLEGAHAPDRREGGHPADAVRVEAACCGALSCHVRDPLYEVVREGETRVLCAEHAEEWEP
jgi:hypothetical protein